MRKIEFGQSIKLYQVLYNNEVSFIILSDRIAPLNIEHRVNLNYKISISTLNWLLHRGKRQGGYQGENRL